MPVPGGRVVLRRSSFPVLAAWLVLGSALAQHEPADTHGRSRHGAAFD
jgi:hypothetical protein